MTKTIQNAIVLSSSTSTAATSASSSSKSSFKLPEITDLTTDSLLELLKELVRLDRGDYFESREFGSRECLPRRGDNFCRSEEIDDTTIELIEAFVSKLERAETGDLDRELSEVQREQLASLLEQLVWYPTLNCKYARNRLLVADLHSHAGLLRHSNLSRGENDDYEPVIKSLTKSLYMYKKSSRRESVASSKNAGKTRGAGKDMKKHFREPDQIALASHRLGLAYADAGKFLDATMLLQQAIEFYNRKRRALVCLTDHPLITTARRELDYCEEQAFQKLLLCNPDSDDLIAMIDAM